MSDSSAEDREHVPRPDSEGRAPAPSPSSARPAASRPQLWVAAAAATLALGGFWLSSPKKSAPQPARGVPAVARPAAPLPVPAARVPDVPITPLPPESPVLPPAAAPTATSRRVSGGMAHFHIDPIGKPEPAAALPEVPGAERSEFPGRLFSGLPELPTVDASGAVAPDAAAAPEDWRRSLFAGNGGGDVSRPSLFYPGAPAAAAKAGPCEDCDRAVANSGSTNLKPGGVPVGTVQYVGPCKDGFVYRINNTSPFALPATVVGSDGEVWRVGVIPINGSVEIRAKAPLRGVGVTNNL